MPDLRRLALSKFKSRLACSIHFSQPLLHTHHTFRTFLVSIRAPVSLSLSSLSFSATLSLSHALSPRPLLLCRSLLPIRVLSFCLASLLPVRVAAISGPGEERPGWSYNGGRGSIQYFRFREHTGTVLLVSALLRDVFVLLPRFPCYFRALGGKHVAMSQRFGVKRSHIDHEA